MTMTGLILLMTLAQSGEDIAYSGPGRYDVVLSGGQRLTLDISREAGDIFDCLMEGTFVQLHRSQVSSMARVGSDAPSAEDAALRRSVEDLASVDVGAWRRATRVLGSAFPESRSIVLEATSHRQSRVRLLAIQLLGEKGDHEEDGATILRALRDPDASVRRAAIFAARRVGPWPEGTRALLGHLARDDEPNLRKAAVKTLERWDAKDTAGDLVDRMQRESDRGVRKFIGQALTRFLEAELGDDAEAWRRHHDRVSGASKERQRRLIESIGTRES